MPNIDLSILNQRQTPAFYADTLANRPAAGFIGRIFVSTNTYEFYRDNGTGWDLIGGPGTGTVTGGGSLYRVGIWTSTSNIGESADLVFDYSQGHLGINTTTPGTALDVHHDQPTVAILNQTVATNDTRIGFQNNGVGLWRIGNFYNLGENDFGIYDAIGAVQPFTIKKNTQQVLIGGGSGGSGKLVVTSGASDNGVQIVGTNAPSLRIDNLSIGATKRVGLGISTALNNFIQGAVDGNFCIFNGTTSTPASMLFGVYDSGLTNVQEAARINFTRNFLIGSTTDNGAKLQVTGNGFISGSVGIGTTSLTGYNLRVSKSITGAAPSRGITSDGVVQSDVITAYLFSTNSETAAATFSTDIVHYFSSHASTGAGSTITSNTAFMTGNLNGTSVFGFRALSSLTGSSTTQAFRGDIAAGTNKWNLFMNGTAANYLNGTLLIGTTSVGGSKLRIVGLPTSAAGLSSGDIYSNAGILTIVP